MVRLTKNCNKDSESSRAPKLFANDQLDHRTINIPQTPPLPNLDDLTPAKRKLQQPMLIIEGILHNVIHENTRLQSRVMDLELQKENPFLAEKNTIDTPVHRNITSLHKRKKVVPPREPLTPIESVEDSSSSRSITSKRVSVSKSKPAGSQR